MEPPLGHRNQRVVAATRLHRVRERRKSGKTILEGPHLLEEALSAGVYPEVVFALPDDERSAGLARRHGLDLVRVEPAALKRLAGTETPQGPAAVIEVPVSAPPTGDGMIVAWGLGDPGNVGTLIRTAAAFGWDFGHTPGTADPWAPKVLRSGAGGHFRIGVVTVGSVDALEEMGLTPVASVVTGGTDPAALGPGRYALLVGEEAPGLPPEVVARCRMAVTIVMPGAMESLNAAMAAGMIVYELSKPGKQRQDRV
ncbi:MAG: TrmH family RNA methyltransferase [Acidimicrobiia bacterium]